MGFMVLYYEDFIPMENGDYYVVLGMTNDNKNFIGEIRNDKGDYFERYMMSRNEMKYWMNENGLYFDGYIEYRGDRDCFKNNI